VPKGLSPRRLAVAGLLLLVVVLGVLVFAPADDTYIFLPNEAHSVEPLVKVEGRRPRDDPGGIYFVDVLVRKASLLERLFPGLRDGSRLVPAEALNPTGISDDARRQGNLRQMTRSQRIAAAVAFREVDYDVKADPAGALVALVAPGSPASKKLQPTDIIVAVDGAPVRTPGDLRRLLGRREPGDSARLGVRRGTDRLRFSLRTVRDDETGRPVIGVIVEQAADIRLPLDVEIDTGDVGGPSAGLAFTLELLEQLGRDVDRGLDVAVTGEIELDGRVGAVGGIQQKVIGAKRSKVDVFVVPTGDNAAEARRYGDGVRVLAVRTLDEALRGLATIAAEQRQAAP